MIHQQIEINHYCEVPAKYRLFGLFRPFKIVNPNQFTALFPIICTLILSIYMLIKISIYRWYQATKLTTYWDPYGRVDVELQIIQMWFWFVVFFCQGFTGIWAWVNNDLHSWKRYFKTYKLRFIATSITAFYWFSFLLQFVIQFFDQNYNYSSLNTTDPITPLAQLIVVVGAYVLDIGFLYLTYVFFVKKFYLKMQKIDNDIEKISLFEKYQQESFQLSQQQQKHLKFFKQPLNKDSFEQKQQLTQNQQQDQQYQ